MDDNDLLNLQVHPKPVRQLDFRLSPEILQYMITRGWKGDGLECTAGLPPDAKFIRVFLSGQDNFQYIHLVFEHESFAEVDPGNPLPFGMVMMARHYGSTQD